MPIKELGQNFLTDKKVAQMMVDSLELKSGDLIEVGPGQGILTRLIAERIKDKEIILNAVEVDNKLYVKLTKEFSGFGNIKIFNEDILGFLPKYECVKTFSIIGSLPYYITSPILHKVIKMKKLPEVCIFLVQKEVAEKIKSGAPDSSYLSSFIQAFFDVAYLGKIPAGKFNPVPGVDGGIVKLKKRQPDISMNPDFVLKYEGFLHRAFSHPRKMLNKAFTDGELLKGGISPNLRAQNLNADEWIKFFRVLNPGL